MAIRLNGCIFEAKTSTLTQEISSCMLEDEQLFVTNNIDKTDISPSSAHINAPETLHPEDDTAPRVADHYKLFQSSVPPSAQAYFSGGSGAELSLSRNISSWRDIALVPKVLIPATKISIIPSRSLPSSSCPLLIAPMALQTLAHKDGELAVARAAKAHNVPMILSTLSSTSLEEVATSNATCLFQLYVLRSRTATLSLVNRARKSGYTALVLTVDAPRYGRREREAGADFVLPKLPHVTEHTESGKNGLEVFGRLHLDGDLDWNALKWLVTHAGMPVYAKGILRGEDAERAIREGASGIIVSNHGGRQVDGAISTAEVLEEIAQVVNGRVPVLVDCGIREPEDVVKAIALGADGVLLGRPILWALAADGERGVGMLLQKFKKGIALTMGLCGATCMKEITRDIVFTPEDRVVRAVERALRNVRARL